MPHSKDSIHRIHQTASLTFPALCISLVFLAGCVSISQNPEATPPADHELTEEEVIHEAIHWVRNSAEYRATFEQTYKLAGERIQQLAEGREPGSWAVSLDADETLVDNSQYQVEIGWRGEKYGPESWNEWIQRKSAPALPGTVEFTHLVQSLGGIVAVVTNRRHHQCQPTVENLDAVGIAWDVGMCRVDDGEKEPRYDALADGTTSQWLDVQYNGVTDLPPLDVLMWVGDNIGDFPGPDQSIRNSEEPLSDFGDRFFMLPNPMYGSWEGNPRE